MKESVHISQIALDKLDAALFKTIELAQDVFTALDLSGHIFYGLDADYQRQVTALYNFIKQEVDNRK